MKSLCDICDRDFCDFPSVEDVPRERLPEVREKYIEWKQNIGETGLFKILFADYRDIVVRKNDFPYYFEEGIEHYVVWLHPEQTKYKYTPRMDRVMIDEVKTTIGCDYEIIHFRNTPVDRTIGSIEHYHILIRRNK